MGTNFYVQKDYCENCGRFDEIHIGKSSIGWQFTFEGTKYKSFAEWCQILRASDIIIRDEHENVVRFTDLLLLIKQKQADITNRKHAVEYPKNNWEDIEGYQFIGTDFS